MRRTKKRKTENKILSIIPIFTVDQKEKKKKKDKNNLIFKLKKEKSKRKKELNKKIII